MDTIGFCYYVNKAKWLLVITILSVFISCNTNTDNTYFNGKVTIIDDSKVPIIKLVSNEISFEYVFSPIFSVFDSLIFFYNYERNEDDFITICNINNRECIGTFCAKGNGHNESLGVAEIFYFYKEGSDLKTDQITINNGDLRVWNITKSIEKRTTVYDTIFPYDKGDGGGFYSSYHRLGDNELFMSTPGVYLTQDRVKATLPKYTKRTLYTNEKIREYDIFLESIESGQAINSELYFHSSYFAKPDGTKIAQGMYYMSQLNILDTATGKCFGYKIKDTHNFSDLRNISSVSFGYASVRADNSFIYALYYGKSDYPEFKCTNIVHVFDWNGNLVKKLELDKNVVRTWLDTANNLLYAVGKEEVVYCYDLNKL